MCGIVRRPTRRKDFDPANFPNLPASSVLAIVTTCEDVHIPQLATSLVLRFADRMANKRDFVMEVIPFALYQSGKRVVSHESTEAEAAVMHLAMAGSVRRTINSKLAHIGLILELGHCCDIEMWERSRENEALHQSHDRNIYRADRLRELKPGAETVVSAEEFTWRSRDDDFDWQVVQIMHDLATEYATA